MKWKISLALGTLLFSVLACTENQNTKTTSQTAENQNITVQTDTNVAPPKYTADSVKTIKVSLDSPHNNKKYIYFTIDDGPSKYSTDIVEMAKDKNVKMTVFLIGKNMEWKAYDNALANYRQNSLIELANHSYSHANNHYNAFYSRPNNVLMDFYKNIVTYNFTNNYVRFPGSPAWVLNGREKNVQKTRRAAANLFKEKGFQIFGWDAEWEFSYKNGAPKYAAERVLEEIETELRTNNTFVKNHCVLLLHERMFQQKWEIARLITMLQQKGYIFEHLKNYPKS